MERSARLMSALTHHCSGCSVKTFNSPERNSAAAWRFAALAQCTGRCEVNAIVNCSRRSFLKSSALAGGGLILGVYIPGLRNSVRAADQPASTVALNAFVRIAPDETVTVVVNHSELGQGPYTSIPMVVAEELDADWNKVRYEAAPVDPAYNHTIFGMQMTGGSTSTWTEWERVRKAGAAARQMLVTAAAKTWK